MEQSAETKSKKYGKIVGKELQGFARLVRPTEASQPSRELGTVGKKYEQTTGRDARYDGKVAAIVGLTTAGVIGAGLLVAAASHVVVTGLILAAGTAGVAGCCKLTGHDEEYNQIVNASSAAVHTVVQSTRDFAGGIVEGVHNPPNTSTAAGPSGYARVDTNSASDSPAAGVSEAGVPSATSVVPPTAATENTPALPPYLSVASGSGSLYPPVYAPAPPAAGGKKDLIDFDDAPPKP